MQSSQIPDKSQRVFAQDATGTYVRTIPQTTADPAAAAYDIGFPPQTFTDESAGGSPPDGRDFNGILRALSAWSRWQQAGGPVRYDAGFQSAIGGYPKGAIIQSATTDGLEWCSTAENNTSNPDGGGGGWIPLLGRRATPSDITTGTEDAKVVTPKGLKDAGVVFVTSQNLNPNNGWMVYSNGFKKCWGSATYNGNAFTTINYPIAFSSWSKAWVQAARVDTDAKDNNPAVTTTDLTSFMVWSSVDSALSGNWMAEGV